MRPITARDAPGAGDERRRFTADEVLRMLDAGILAEDDHVELIRGELLTVTPQGPIHRSLKDELHARLIQAYAGRDVHVLDQGPLRAGPSGLPEPDLAVVRGRARDYLQRHPEGHEVVLVVELAKTSQDRDRAKAADYAAGGVPVYWLVDLVARVVEVYADPDRELGRFRTASLLDENGRIGLPELDAQWTVASLLP